MDKLDGYLKNVGLSRDTSIGDAITKISGKGGSRRKRSRRIKHRCRPGCKHKRRTRNR